LLKAFSPGYEILVSTRDRKILDELIGLDGRLYEDRLYELVMQEVLTEDFDTVAMARAFEEAEGEEQKTKALYLKHRLRRLMDESLVKNLIDEAQSSPEKLIENINSKIDKLTKDRKKSSLLSLLTLLCLAFFALTDFVGGDMYYFVIILLGIFFLGFTISASSTESKIQLLEKECEKIKNSVKISKPELGWVRWIFKSLITILLIVFALFAWGITEEVSWFLTKTFSKDLSSVDVSATMASTIISILFYMLLIGSCMLLIKKLWFPK
jgi:ABC-type multidrug transport system fused ATPase/permease subunit|tara:strand:- start:588 stop:1391 length:804 start_codon:yes stop_codon:yes gene_type:complete